MKSQKIKHKMTVPQVITVGDRQPIENFPVRHYSYSSLVLYSTNPFLFKLKYINGDMLTNLSGIGQVVGNAFHRAMEVFYGNIVEDDADALQRSLEEGLQYIDDYNDAMIEFNTKMPNKQKAQEVFAFAFNAYMAETSKTDEKVIECEECITADVDVEWQNRRVKLPVTLKGYLDKVTEDKNGLLRIRDYKTTARFSDPDKIDGRKIIQAIQYFFLVFAKYGRAPYSMVYEEVKYTKNRDGSPQVKEYEIVYADNPLFFDFYLRLYSDVTSAINGEASFVPNINAMYDNEIGIIAYIHRLDVGEEAARQMKDENVKNITELLGRKIVNAGNMRKLLKTAEKAVTEAKSINYEDMLMEDKIRTKLMEFGMIIHYVDTVVGNTVDLYRYKPQVGVKMSKLKTSFSDVEQAVGVSGVRVLAPIPNTTLIGFEVPRKQRTFPDKALAVPRGTEIAIGMDVCGDIYHFDITKAPHMLVAGATGSGKSVFLNSVISQLLTLDNAELHLFDPKLVELSQFRHQAMQYETDPESIYICLDDLVNEMNARYTRMQAMGVRSIAEMPDMKYKFVVIDEFGDLIVSNHELVEEIQTGETYKNGEPKTKMRKTNISQEIMKNILILAQKARAAGIHLIIATQRPSVDIITGSIRANFPCKVAFRTAKETDSRVMLDEAGAEKLLGKGDMIFSSDEGQYRLQGFDF